MNAAVCFYQFQNCGMLKSKFQTLVDRNDESKSEEIVLEIWMLHVRPSRNI